MQLNFFRNLYKPKIGGNLLIKEFSGYSLSTIIFHSSRILTELLVAKLVGPEIFGIWYMLNLLLTYRSVTYFGVVNGMMLNIPILLGKQKQGEAQVYQNVAFFVVILSVVLTSIVLLALAYLNLSNYAAYFFPLILLFFANQYYYFIDALFLSYANFKSISKMQILCAFLFPCISVPLVYLYELSGFIIGTSLSYLGAVLIVYWKLGISVKLQFDVPVFKKLVKIGFPIMLVGIIYTFFITVDRWMIEIMLGTEYLGIFSMAILAFGVLTILPATMARQFYSRMAFDWGRTNSKEVLKDWCRKQAKYIFYIILVTVVALLAVFPLIIRYWLPQYQDSIVPIVIISIGVLSLPISAGWGDIINILGRQKLYVIVSAVFILVNIILSYFFISIGLGISGVALATTVAFILFNITIRGVAQQILKGAEGSISGQ